MKASNPQVMVQAYRLLVNRLNTEELLPYPLHLGVTEAGEGEDGRIKSALGIGSLLEDGLGDTVRVSLTEEPEFEAPIARMLVDRYLPRKRHQDIAPIDKIPIDPFSFKRRKTLSVENIGGGNVPRVIADFSDFNDLKYEDLAPIGHRYLPILDKWTMDDTGADYLFTGSQPADFMLPNGLREIVDYSVWKSKPDQSRFPLLTSRDLGDPIQFHPTLNFVIINSGDLSIVDKLKTVPNLVVVLETQNLHSRADLRRFVFEMMLKEVTYPVMISGNYSDDNPQIKPTKCCN